MHIARMPTTPAWTCTRDGATFRQEHLDTVQYSNRIRCHWIFTFNSIFDSYSKFRGYLIRWVKFHIHLILSAFLLLLYVVHQWSLQGHKTRCHMTGNCTVASVCTNKCSTLQMEPLHDKPAMCDVLHLMGLYIMWPLEAISVHSVDWHLPREAPAVAGSVLSTPSRPCAGSLSPVSHSWSTNKQTLTQTLHRHQP